jgi:sialate O-acetylesterase
MVFNRKKISMKIPMVALMLMVLGTNSFAEFKLPGIIADHMVLQREKSLRIWGKGDNGTEVTVSFKHQTKSTVVENGQWLVSLDPEQHGGPFEMKIQHGSTVKTIKDILIGEVWQAAGQSNMQWSVMSSKSKDDTLKLPENDQLRLFKQLRSPQGEPSFDTAPRSFWAVDNSGSRKHFSAVAYHFAHNLQKSLGIPVGISQASEGGTKCQYWTPLEAFKSKPEYKDYLELALDSKNRFQEIKQTFEVDVAEWLRKRKAKENAGPAPVHYGRYPSFYYNGNIHPIVNYTIRGAIWYQGERNSINTRDAYEYRDYFPLMIQSWRAAFRNPEMPFYFVQLPKLHPRDNRDVPVIRESQLWTAQNLKNANMIVSFDQGEAELHPKTKRYMGQRLTNMALAEVYGQEVDYRFPLYKSVETKGASMVVHFEHVGEGLVPRDGQALREFSICGADKKFVKAEAKISGDTVVVSSPKVSSPVAVRYAWSNAPDVNLVGKNGLPASAFRTDDFKLPEKNPRQKNYTHFQ